MNYIQRIKNELFNITNEVRVGFGLQPVEYSNHLDRMGQIHTNEMYTHNFFLHKNPHCKKVESLEDRIKYCGLNGLFDLVGENLADYPAVDNILVIRSASKLFNKLKPRPLLSPQILCRNIVKGWYNSPGHRANLFYSKYNFVGFGLLLYPKICFGAKLKNLLVTQNFGRGK